MHSTLRHGPSAPPLTFTISALISRTSKWSLSHWHVLFTAPRWTVVHTDGRSLAGPPQPILLLICLQICLLILSGNQCDLWSWEFKRGMRLDRVSEQHLNLHWVHKVRTSQACFRGALPLDAIANCSGDSITKLRKKNYSLKARGHAIQAKCN